MRRLCGSIAFDFVSIAHGHPCFENGEKKFEETAFIQQKKYSAPGQLYVPILRPEREYLDRGSYPSEIQRRKNELGQCGGGVQTL